MIVPLYHCRQIVPGELKIVNWEYEMRREMQEILPDIFLGPYKSASKSELVNLKSKKITHILCVRQDIEARIIKPNFPEHFTYKIIEMRDHHTENIITKLSEAIEFIQGALDAGGKILIHGVNGKSRSGALVIAYIMEAYDLSYQDALTIVKRRRNCVCVNIGFQDQLVEYEPIYRARNEELPTDDRPRPSLKRQSSDENHEARLEMS